MAYVHNRLSEIHQNKLCFLTLRSNRGQNRPLKGPFLLKINLPGYPPVKKRGTATGQGGVHQNSRRHTRFAGRLCGNKGGWGRRGARL